ncbi:unnamed protein product [Caretta caretta]
MGCSDWRDCRGAGGPGWRRRVRFGEGRVGAGPGPRFVVRVRAGCQAGANQGGGWEQVGGPGWKAERSSEPLQAYSSVIWIKTKSELKIWPIDWRKLATVLDTIE